MMKDKRYDILKKKNNDSKDSWYLTKTEIAKSKRTRKKQKQKETEKKQTNPNFSKLPGLDWL